MPESTVDIKPKEEPKKEETKKEVSVPIAAKVMKKEEPK